MAEKLYAGSRGQLAENFALLDKIRIFVFDLWFIDFLPRLYKTLWGDAPTFGTIFSAFIVDETPGFCLSIC